MTDLVPCPECGARPHSADRYCPDCGAHLPTGETAGQRADPDDPVPVTTAVDPAAGVAVAGAGVGAAGEEPGSGAHLGFENGAGPGAGGPSSATMPEVGPSAKAPDAASPSAIGTWSPRAESGRARAVGTGGHAASAGSVEPDAEDPAPGTVRVREAGGIGIDATQPNPGVGTADAYGPTGGERPIAPAAAAAAEAAVAAADGSGSAGARRPDRAHDEDPGWFAGSNPGAMLALGLVLVVAGVLLVLVGKIDRTGTIGIIGLLIAVGGAFMIPLAGIRAIADRIL